MIRFLSRVSVVLVTASLVAVAGLASAQDAAAPDISAPGQDGAAAAAGADGAEDLEKSWAVDLNTAFLTDYMFRGYNFYDGVSVQPSIAASYSFGDRGTVGAQIFSHISAETDRKNEGFTEIDYGVSYEYVLDPVTLTVGHYWYTYPEDDTDFFMSSREFFVSASFADLPGAPTFSYFQDYSRYHYEYYEINFSHQLEIPQLGKGFVTTPYIAFGFQSGAPTFYYKNDGPTHIAVGTNFELTLGDVVITPTVNYNFKIDELTSNELWGGMTFTYSL